MEISMKLIEKPTGETEIDENHSEISRKFSTGAIKIEYNFYGDSMQMNGQKLWISSEIQMGITREFCFRLHRSSKEQCK